MSTPITWDTHWANSEQPKVIGKVIGDYFASGVLPIEELNKRESMTTEAGQEATELREEPEPLFGENLRATLRAIKRLRR